MEINSQNPQVNSLKPKITKPNSESQIELRQNIDLMEKAKNEVKEVKKVTQEELETQIETMNQMMEVKNTGLKFNFHDELDRIYVQVVDKKTEEVVREIPPEKFLDMISSMLEFVGLMIDEKI